MLFVSRKMTAAVIVKGMNTEFVLSLTQRKKLERSSTTFEAADMVSSIPRYPNNF